MLAMIQRGEGEALRQELPRWLAEASQAGSGDDITVGLLHCQEVPPPAISTPISDGGGG
jgi:hypothetical protein